MIPKGNLKGWTDNTMGKRKRTKGLTMFCQTLHRKLNIEQQCHFHLSSNLLLGFFFYCLHFSKYVQCSIFLIKYAYKMKTVLSYILDIITPV